MKGLGAEPAAAKPAHQQLRAASRLHSNSPPPPTAAAARAPAIANAGASDLVETSTSVASAPTTATATAGAGAGAAGAPREDKLQKQARKEAWEAQVRSKRAAEPSLGFSAKVITLRSSPTTFNAPIEAPM
jgi:hypothetical protein